MSNTLKNRTELAKLFAENGFKRGAEVGVCYGIYSERLFKAIPDLQLIAVDNWDNAETERRKRVHARDVETWCRNALANYKPIIIKSDSVKAAELIADECLDFVYLDADHSYEAVKEDLEAWTPKVRKGGIVSGHDYYVFPNSGNDGVVRAVDEYCKAHNYTLHATEWDRDNPERDERQPSWYFTK